MNNGIDDNTAATYSDPNGIINNPQNDLQNEVGNITEVAYRETDDYDGDNIPNVIDLDSDNDGIPDEFECPSMVFSLGDPTSINGADNLDVHAGDYFIFEDALQVPSTGEVYDVIYHFTYLSTDLVAEIKTGGQLFLYNIFPGLDSHILYNISIIEDGSSTAANPAGTLHTFDKFTMTIGDLDSRNGNGDGGVAGELDFTDVGGFSNAYLPDYYSQGVNIVQQDFVNGFGPANYTTFMSDPSQAGAVDDWIDEGNANDQDPTVTTNNVQLYFSNFSNVDMVY